MLNHEAVSNVHSEESGHFAMIDPSADVVWTIYVLTDIA